MMTCHACHMPTKHLVLQERGAHRGELWCRGCTDHAKGETEMGVAVFRDEIPGGVTLENYGPEPMTFYSHSERRAYMATHGLSERETFCPAPGTDKDPQGIPNPAGYVDAYTLANGAELICRNGKSEEFDGIKSGVLRNLTVETVADAERMRDAFHR